MNGAIIAFVLAGLVAFGAGAALAAMGERGPGIALMGVGLLFQVLTLVRLKQAKHKGSNNARGSS